MTTSDRQLLIEAHRGCETSARALWKLHAPRLFVYANALMRNHADAEDAVQNAMCRVLALPAPRVREVREVGAFLASVVRSTSINMIRTRRRERRRIDQRLPLHAPESQSAAMLLNGLDADLAAAIQRLPRRLAEVVILKHIAGLTFDELASTLSQNRNTIAARHRAAMEQLRTILTPTDESPVRQSRPRSDADKHSSAPPIPPRSHLAPAGAAAASLQLHRIIDYA